MEDKNQTTKKEKLVLAKLVSVFNFKHGDFMIISGVSAGTLLPRVAFAEASDSDKGAIPKLGEIFTIIGFIEGVDGTNTLPTRLELDRMEAIKVTKPNDVIHYVESTKADPFASILNSVSSAVFNTWMDAGALCNKAPVNLQEAIKQMRGVSGTGYKSIPRNADIEPTGDDKNSNTTTSPIIEYGNDGSISLSVGGNGFTVDKDGGLFTNGKVTNNKPAVDPHSLIGIPRMQNPLLDVSPRMIFNPQIDGLPDFSIFEWIIKLYSVFDVLSRVVSVKVEKDKKGNVTNLKFETNRDFKKEYFKSIKEKAV